MSTPPHLHPQTPHLRSVAAGDRPFIRHIFVSSSPNQHHSPSLHRRKRRPRRGVGQSHPLICTSRLAQDDEPSPRVRSQVETLTNRHSRRRAATGGKDLVPRDGYRTRSREESGRGLQRRRIGNLSMIVGLMAARATDRGEWVRRRDMEALIIQAGIRKLRSGGTDGL